MEGNEPLFFTRFFASWDSSKAYVSPYEHYPIFDQDIGQYEDVSFDKLDFHRKRKLLTKDVVIDAWKLFSKETHNCQKWRYSSCKCKTLLSASHSRMLKIDVSLFCFSVFRSRDEDPQLHMEDVQVFLKNHSNVQEACLLVQKGSVSEADLQRLTRWLLLSKTRMLEISQLLPHL